MRKGKLFALISLFLFSFEFVWGHCDGPMCGVPLEDPPKTTGTETSVTEDKKDTKKEKAIDKANRFNYEKFSEQILPDEEDEYHKIYTVAGTVATSFLKTITQDKMSALKPGIPYRFNHINDGWSWWTWDDKKNEFVAMTQDRMTGERFSPEDLGFKEMGREKNFKGRETDNKNPPPEKYFVFGPENDYTFALLMQKDPTMGGQIPKDTEVNVPASKKTSPTSGAKPACKDGKCSK